MESRNPALRNAIKQAEAAQAPADSAGTTGSAAPQAAAATATSSAAAIDAITQQQFQSMQAAPAGTATVQLPDVVAKTGMIFALLLIGAVVGWNTAMTMPWLWIAAAVGALVLGLVNSFKRKVSPPLVLAYGLVEGVMLGAISRFYQEEFAAPGQSLVLQAVIGTFTAFGVMLFLYTNRIIKVNGTFKKVFLVALISYAVIGLASLIGALFGVGGGWGFYGVGGLGIVLCVFGVALAAFSLAMDFESIKQAIAYGLPEREAWRLSFGLIVTLVWLYLEILRLLAIVSSNSR